MKYFCLNRVVSLLQKFNKNVHSGLTETYFILNVFCKRSVLRVGFHIIYNNIDIFLSISVSN